MSRTLYGQLWNSRRREMYEPITLKQAEERFKHGPWFAVAVFDDEDSAIPRFVLDIHPQARDVSATFYNNHGSCEKAHHFRSVNGALFLEQTTNYTYPDPPVYHAMSDASVVVIITYNPSGEAQSRVDDASRPDIELTSYSDVDVSAHWEAIPEFGQWEGLGTRHRWKAEHPSPDAGG